MARLITRVQGHRVVLWRVPGLTWPSLWGGHFFGEGQPRDIVTGPDLARTLHALNNVAEFERVTEGLDA